MHYQKLVCDLNDTEVQNYSNELARLVTEQAEIEAEKKEVMSDFAAKINKAIADCRVLSRKVSTRKEERQTECDYEYDYVRGMVYTIRIDTGVTISSRKLTDDERQERLDFENEQDPQEEQWRDATCKEWRTCDYADECFKQNLDVTATPACLKDEAAQNTKQYGVTL